MTMEMVGIAKPVGANSVGATLESNATWIGKNYWPNPPALGYYAVPTPVQQKSDAPFMLATLAQLLDEGKITEETFSRLAERLIQQVR